MGMDALQMEDAITDSPKVRALIQRDEDGIEDLSSSVEVLLREVREYVDQCNRTR